MSRDVATRSARTLQAAEEVCAVLESHGAPAVLIGALALAVHRFARFTEDLDCARHGQGAALEPLLQELGLTSP